MIDAQGLEAIHHARPDLLAPHVGVLAELEGDIVEDAHGVEERRHLEHHAELAPHPRELHLAEGHDVFAVDQDLSLVGPLEADELTHQHRLARARGADDHVAQAARHVEGDAPQHVVLPVALVHVHHAHVHRIVRFGRGRHLSLSSEGHPQLPTMMLVMT